MSSVERLSRWSKLRTVLWPASTFRNSPSDILSRHLQIAELTVDTVLERYQYHDQDYTVATHLGVDNQFLAVLRFYGRLQ